MHAQLKKREENIAKIQGQLVIEKRQKKRFKLQKEAGKQVLTNNAELSEVLPELSIEQTETARNVISNMFILNGNYIEHLWFTEQIQNILYHGHIISVKSTGKVPKATICYWTHEDIEEEGEDEKICILQLLTDYVTGDMIFVDFSDM